MLSQVFKHYIEKSLSEKLRYAIQVINYATIGGGCINDTYRLQTSAGAFFIKYNNAAKYPRIFETEAKGLSLLRSTKTLKIPEVVISGEAEGKSFLMLEYIEAGKRKKDFWEDFGKKLATLHRYTSSSFGLDHDNYIGSLPQSNKHHKAWIDFFVEERLQKQIALAKDSGAINNLTIHQFDNLLKRLPEIIPDEKPSMLHGDLWNGNYMISGDGSASLIDPAVYYGHREMDLAMTRLFGGFDDEFYESYNKTFPLTPGFEERVAIHNLYPLMVHVNLFGGGYMSQVKSILSKF
jgi:fructosamine-3-kinase